MITRKIRKIRKGYNYRRKGVYGRVRVPAHKVTYYSRTNLSSLRPFKMSKRDEASIQRDIKRIQQDVKKYYQQIYPPSKEAESRIIKQLETPPKIKFEEELRKELSPKAKKEIRIIHEIERKGEGLTEQKIAQRHRSEEGQKRAEEKKEDPFFDFRLSDNVKSLASKKYDLLLKRDPQGKNVDMNAAKKRAIYLAEEELKGQQKIIPGVQTYDEQEYIASLKELGLPEQEAKNIFFSTPSDEINKRTPEQFATYIDRSLMKMGQSEFKEGEFIEKPSTIQADEASSLIDDLIKVRPDLKNYNRITLINKLKSDLRETSSETKGMNRSELVRGLLNDYFSVDKPLKESLESEREQL